MMYISHPNGIDKVENIIEFSRIIKYNKSENNEDYIIEAIRFFKEKNNGFDLLIVLELIIENKLYSLVTEVFEGKSFEEEELIELERNFYMFKYLDNKMYKTLEKYIDFHKKTLTFVGFIPALFFSKVTSEFLIKNYSRESFLLENKFGSTAIELIIEEIVQIAFYNKNNLSENIEKFKIVYFYIQEKLKDRYLEKIAIEKFYSKTKKLFMYECDIFEKKDVNHKELRKKRKELIKELQGFI